MSGSASASSASAAPFRVGAASAGSLFSSGGPASGLASASASAPTASAPTFFFGASTASVSLNGTDVHVMLLSLR